MKVSRIGEVQKVPFVSPLFTSEDVTIQAILPDSQEYDINVVSFGRGVRLKFHAHDSEQKIKIRVSASGQDLPFVGVFLTLSWHPVCVRQLRNDSLYGLIGKGACHTLSVQRLDCKVVRPGREVLDHKRSDPRVRDFYRVRIAARLRPPIAPAGTHRHRCGSTGAPLSRKTYREQFQYLTTSDCFRLGSVI